MMAIPKERSPSGPILEQAAPHDRAEAHGAVALWPDRSYPH